MRYTPYREQPWLVPHSELGEPKKDFADTFSAVTALKEEFAPAQEHPAPANENAPVRERRAPTDRKGDWMQLSDGTAFWPLDPVPWEVSIESIAHALGMIVRYCGHVHTFYSVGEHSVHLCRWVHTHGGTAEEQLWALLHDAPESKGLTDIIRPVKPYIVGYKPLETAVMDAVCDRFNLARQMPSIVHEADGRILHDEKAQAMGAAPYNWSLAGVGLGIELQFWSPSQAKAEFLSEFWRIVETGRM